MYETRTQVQMHLGYPVTTNIFEGHLLKSCNISFSSYVLTIIKYHISCLLNHLFMWTFTFVMLKFACPFERIHVYGRTILFIGTIKYVMERLTNNDCKLIGNNASPFSCHIAYKRHYHGVERKTITDETRKH